MTQSRGAKGHMWFMKDLLLAGFLKVCYILIKHMKLNMAWAERASSDNLETL